LQPEEVGKGDDPDYPTEPKDGGIRAYLGYVGITKDQWERLTPEVRVTLRESLRLLLPVLEAAVFIAADPDQVEVDLELQRRALAFLERLAKEVSSDSTRNAGFQKAVAMRDRWRFSRSWLKTIEQVLAGIHARGHAEKRATFLDETWATNAAREVNASLSVKLRVPTTACTTEHIAQLQAEPPRTVALQLVEKLGADPDVARRATPRHRGS
jgi:hypothetical protein